MEEYMKILRTLRKGDRISQNVLLMIAESQVSEYEVIGKYILTYYKECINKDSVRDLIRVLCEKNEDYLEYFSRYSKIFETRKDDFYILLEENKTKNRDSENTKKRRLMDDTIKECIDKEEIDTPIVDISILQGKVQCKLCGLRYDKEDDLYEIHIEDHLRKSRAMEGKRVLSREYFSTYDAWIRSVEKIQLTLKINKTEKILHNGIVYCTKCKEKIETMWDDEEDSFVLCECVQLDESKFCHKRCVA